jgi:acetyl esterase
MALDPQIKALLEQLAEGGNPSPETLTVAQNRTAIAGMAPLGGAQEPMAAVSDRVAVLEGREIGLRIYTPVETNGAQLPVTVFFHGGGWVAGDLDSQDRMARGLAKQSGSIVVSVDYRLAPEHRFPAAVDDAYDVLSWVVANAGDFHGDSDRLVVFGESAGGNIAAAAVQLAARRGGPRILLQVLAYPAVDRWDDSPSMTENAVAPVLTRSYLEWFWGCYLNTPDEGADPRVSPARAADLSGLPPAVVVTAEYDPLRDQGNRYAELLRNAGVPVQHLPVSGTTHAFLAFTGSVQLSRDVLGRLGDAIAAAVFTQG